MTILRWITRVLFLCVLSACLCAWAISYRGALRLQFPNHAARADIGWNIGAVEGVFYAIHDTGLEHFASWAKVDFSPGRTIATWGLAPMTYGFYFGNWPGGATTFTLTFPLWAPALLLLAVFAWWLWRKLRQRPSWQGAFPVEPVAAPAQTQAPESNNSRDQTT